MNYLRKWGEFNYKIKNGKVLKNGWWILSILCVSQDGFLNDQNKGNEDKNGWWLG